MDNLITGYMTCLMAFDRLLAQANCRERGNGTKVKTFGGSLAEAASQGAQNGIEYRIQMLACIFGEKP